MGEEEDVNPPQKANAPTREQLLTYIKRQKAKIAELEKNLSEEKALQQRKNEESKVRLETLELTLNESVNGLEKEKGKFLSQANSLKKCDEEAKAQRKEIDELASELNMLRQNNGETKDIIVSLEKSLEKSYNEAKVQRNEISELMNQLNTESASKAELVSKLENALVAEEERNLESQLLGIISENDNLTAQLKTMQEDKDDLESLVAGAGAQQSSKPDVRENNHDENGMGVKELSVANSKLVQQLKESQITRDGLEKQVNERCESTERELENTWRQLEEVRKERDEMLLKWKEDESAFKAKHNVLLHEVEQLRVQAEQARHGKEMLLQQPELMVTAVASETEPVDLMNQNNQGGMDSVNKVSEREEDLSSQLRSLQNENMALRSDLDARDSDIRQHAMHIEELELKMHQNMELAQQESLDLKNEVEQLCNERNGLLSETEKMKQVMNSNQQAISQEANEALMRLKCDRDTLQQQLDAANKRSDDQEGSIQPLEEARIVAETHRTELESQLHQLEERMKISNDRCSMLLKDSEANLNQVEELKQQLKECQTGLQEATEIRYILQHDRDSIQQQLKSVLKEGEEGVKSLDAQVIETNAQLEATMKRLLESEDRCAMLVTEKDSKCTEVEGLEDKLKRLKVLLTKSQRALSNKDAQLKKAQIQRQETPPSSVLMHLRVRFEGGNWSEEDCDDGSIWCLLESTTTDLTHEESGKVDGETKSLTNKCGNPELCKKSSWLWQRQTKVLEWIRDGSTNMETPEAEWPAPMQDSAREVQRALQSEISRQTYALESIQDEFSKYKQRAQTALRKPINSKIQAQANEIIELRAALDTLSEDNKQISLLLEQEKSNSEKGVEQLRSQLDEMQSQRMEMKANIDRQASSITEYEARCSHLEDELSTTQEDVKVAHDVEATLRTSEKDLENSMIEKDELITSLREELQLAKTVAMRETPLPHRETHSSYIHLSANNAIENDWQQSPELRISTSNQNLQLGSSSGAAWGDGSTEKKTLASFYDGASSSVSAIEDSDSVALPRLLALDARRDRDRSEKCRDAAAISQLHLEVIDTSSQLELLTSQNQMLKETIRGLEADIAREHTLNTGINAEMNTEYLKVAVFRYMASPDAAEKKLLLSVIAAILKLTREETAQVEQRIHEMESGGLRRMSGVIGGTVGAVGGVVGGVAGGAKGVWNYVKGGSPSSSSPTTTHVLLSTEIGNNGSHELG